MSILCSCDNQPQQTELTIEHPKNVKLKLNGKRILLYGDSMSSTSYPPYKEAMEKQTGATVILAGYDGYTTSMLAEDKQLERIYENKPDVVICLLGGNDVGKYKTVGSFGAATTEPTIEETNIENGFHGGYHYFIQAVSHLMRRIDYHYISNSEAKPYVIFCTPLPQNRAGDYSDFSDHRNWLRKRNAVVECCNKYNVHCVDLYKLTAWDMSEEPLWTTPTDIVNNKGTFTMDGLHPNKKGYEQIVSIICKEIE